MTKNVIKHFKLEWQFPFICLQFYQQLSGWGVVEGARGEETLPHCLQCQWDIGSAPALVANLAFTVVQDRHRWVHLDQRENLGSDQRLTCGSLYSSVQPSERSSEDDSLQQHPSTWGVSGGVCRVPTRQHAVTFRTSTKHRDDPVGFLQGPGLGRRWGPSSVTPLWKVV